MAPPRKDAIEEKDLHGFKHFRLLMPVLEKLHENGWVEKGDILLFHVLSRPTTGQEYGYVFNAQHRHGALAHPAKQQLLITAGF